MAGAGSGGVGASGASIQGLGNFGLPGDSDGKESACKRLGFDP